MFINDTSHKSIFSKPLHIFFPTAWYPNRLEKNDGVFVEKHACTLSAIHKVSVLVVKPDASLPAFRLNKNVSDKGNLLEVRVYVPKIKFEIPFFTGILRLVVYMIGALIGYFTIRRMRGRVDISHVNILTRACGVPYLLKKFCNIPYIITEHWSRYLRDEFPKSRLQHFFARVFVRNAYILAPVSNVLRESISAKGLKAERYIISPNVVDTATFRPDNKIHKSEVITMIHVSWFRDSAKNISGLLRTVSKMRDKRRDFRLALVGDGGDKDVLIALANNLGINDFVEFIPSKQFSELANELRKAHFMVMFSNFESQPVALLEALACGLPTVASEVGHIPTMLSNDRGLTVEPGNESDLEGKLNLMLDTWSSYDPHILHEYVKCNYSPDAVLRFYEEQYVKMLGTRC